MPRSSREASGGRRLGSPWTGLGAVVAKETADHLSSARMRILEALVFLTAIAAAYAAIRDDPRDDRRKPVPVPAPPDPLAGPAADRLSRFSVSSSRWSRSRSLSMRSMASSTGAR